MAKDKEKQLLKGTDDKAITFQRAVFIVCNLKRLIKRPKKEEKQQQQQKDKGRGLREPVRRAFTLPSLICSGALARLAAANHLKGLVRPAAGQADAEAGRAPQEPADGGPQRRPQSVRAGLSASPSPADLFLGAAGCASALAASPVACLATPVRRAHLGGARLSNSGQARASKRRHASRRKGSNEPAAAADAVGLPGCAPAAGASGSTGGGAGNEAVCPVWARLMEQLDLREKRPAFQCEERLLLNPLAAYAGWQQQQQQRASWAPPGRLDPTSGRAVHLKAPRRSSNDDASAAASLVAKRSGASGPKASSHSTSPNSDNSRYAALSGGCTSSQTPRDSKEGQSMKRFSSALCLMDRPAAGGLGASGAQHRAALSGKSSVSAERRAGAPEVAPASCNMDQQALFAAVERNLVETARSILEKGRANVNSLNADKLTCLDIAVLQRNADMLRLLQQHGAEESGPDMTREERADELYALYAEARRSVEDLTKTMGPFAGRRLDERALEAEAEMAAHCQPNGQLMLATGSLLSSALVEEKQRQLHYWRRRLDLYMRMRYELHRLEPPNAPELVILQVVGETALGVKIVHSIQAARSAAPHASGGPRDSDLQPSARLTCRRGAACSHWQLTEAGAAQAALHEPVGVACADQERGLALFNRLLAQQFRLLDAGEREARRGGPPPPEPEQEEQEPSVSGSGARDAPQVGRTTSRRRLRPQRSIGADRRQLEAGRDTPSQLLAAPDDKGSLAYQLIRRQDLLLDGEEPAPEGQERAGCRRRRREPDEWSARVVTKFRVHWMAADRPSCGGGGGGGGAGSLACDDDCESPEMEQHSGSLVLANACGGSQPLECRIEGLASGSRYWVRVSAGNHAGYSDSEPSSPSCLAPSSWRQLDGTASRRRRCDDQEIFHKFSKLFLFSKHLLDERPSTSGAATTPSFACPPTLAAAAPGAPTTAVAAAAAAAAGHLEAPGLGPALAGQPAGAGSVRKNLKSFFQSSSYKFQKLTNQNKRGLYMAAVIYTGQQPLLEPSGSGSTLPDGCKIIVTNDERLPVVEVANELVAPASLMSDFHWLLKINGTQWVDVKRMRQQLQRSHSSSSQHVRIKLLAAVEQLQKALNLEDLGHLFYKPIQAQDGSQVICTCKWVASTKLVASLSIKWTQLAKLLPRHLRKISNCSLGVYRNLQQARASQDSAAGCAPEARHSTTRASNSSSSSLASTSDACLAAAAGDPLASQEPGCAPAHLQAAGPAPLTLGPLTVYDLLLFSLAEVIQFHVASHRPLGRGLYLGFLQLQTTVESMRLLVPRSRPNMLPCARIRDNPHVSREEWRLLRRFGRPGGAGAAANAAAAAAAAAHSSDPSIWLPVKPVEQVGRDRAKSVSPGLLKQQPEPESAQEAGASPPHPSTERAPDARPHERSPQRPEEEAAGQRRLWSASSDFLLAGLTEAQQQLGAKSASSDTQLSAEEPRAPPAGAQTLLTPSLRISGPAEGVPRPSATHSCAAPALAARRVLQTPEETFIRLLGRTARRLLTELRARLPERGRAEAGPQQAAGGGGGGKSVLEALNDEASNRIYHSELIELNEQVSMILLLPAPENVCPVSSQERWNVLADNADYMLLPLQIFETIHISTFERDLLGKYSRLSALLETDLVLAQHDHRQAFSNNEIRSAKLRLDQLQDMVCMAEEFWRKLRWIVDVVAFARDKSGGGAGGAIQLSAIWRHLELTSVAGP